MDVTSFPVAVVVLALIAIIVGFVGFGVMLFKAGSLAHPGPIIVSLSMLTLVALLGAILNDSTELLTLAATGMGALAGALSSLYQSKSSDKKE